MLVHLEEDDAIYFLKVLAAGSVVVVLIGVLYQIAGRWTVLQPDENGNVRLGGSTIPAFLGSFAYLSSFASCILADRLGQKRYLVLWGASFAIAILTGARMPLALTILLCGYVFVSSTRIGLIGKIWAGIYGGILLAAAMLTVGQGVLARFQANSLSNRDKLWAVMLNIADAHPIFGVGLGHQILFVSHDLTARTGTIAAHSEYIRMAMEIGYVGATAFFGLFVVFMMTTAFSRQVKNRLIVIASFVSFFIYALTDNVLSNSMIFIMVAGYCAGVLPRRQAIEKQASAFYAVPPAAEPETQA